MTRFQWIIFILLVTILGGAWIAYSREPIVTFTGVPDLTEAPLAGYLAPDFTLPTSYGQLLTLSDLRGQPVVLNFWATWCPPCRAEMPDLQATSREFNGRVTFLGIDQGENAATVIGFRDEYGITYPLLVDEDSRVNDQYGIRALPTTIFVNADGVVTEVYSGILNKAILESRLKRLLEE